MEDIWKIISATDSPAILAIFLLWLKFKGATDKIDRIHATIQDGAKRLEYSNAGKHFEEATDSIKTIARDTERTHTVTHALKNAAGGTEEFKRILDDVETMGIRIKECLSILSKTDSEGRPKVYFPENLLSQLLRTIGNLEIILREIATGKNQSTA